MSISIYTKQPGDSIDIDIDFSQWLPSTDTISTSSATAEAGITLGSTTNNLTEKKVKQWVSGGTTGNRYKVTVRMTSVEGRIKEVDFYIKVKEI